MMMAYLIWNCRPENREYRYNFLYNNCTTMVRDVIERCVRGRVIYPANKMMGESVYLGYIK